MWQCCQPRREGPRRRWQLLKKSCFGPPNAGRATASPGHLQICRALQKVWVRSPRQGKTIRIVSDEEHVPRVAAPRRVLLPANENSAKKTSFSPPLSPFSPAAQASGARLCMRTLYIDACNHLHPGPPTASQLQAYLQVDRGPCCGSEAQSCSPPSPPFSRRLAVAAMCAKSGGGLHFSCTWKKRAAIQRPILKSVDTSASPERIRGSATEAIRKLASMKPRPAMRPHSTTALPNAP